MRQELKTVAKERLDFFWAQGIRGADFFISAVGPALSVFGRYAQVIRISGEEVTVGEFLDEVRALVTNYALTKIPHTTNTANIEVLGSSQSHSSFTPILRPGSSLQTLLPTSLAGDGGSVQCHSHHEQSCDRMLQSYTKCSFMGKSPSQSEAASGNSTALTTSMTCGGSSICRKKNKGNEQPFRTTQSLQLSCRLERRKNQGVSRKKTGNDGRNGLLERLQTEGR
ncbi:MAG: hypothetical protein ACQESR_10105 [Planctomycetota bacterium]